MPRHQHKIFALLRNLGMAFVVLNGFLPALWLFITSLKPERELVQLPISYWPQSPTWQNYVAVFRDNPFGSFMLNSAVVALSTTLICIILASLSGYALGRLRLPGRRGILTLIVMSSMFPVLILLVPLYRLFVGVELSGLEMLFNALNSSNLPFFLPDLPAALETPNLLNTYWALIIPYTALSLPIAVLILSGFFQLIPADIENAALVDGCTRFGALVRVIAPVSAPGIVTAAIIVFVNSWNEFLIALTFNTRLNMRTVPVGITLYQGEYAFPWAIISAAITLAILPLVVFIIFFQRRIISGLTTGSVKG